MGELNDNGEIRGRPAVNAAKIDALRSTFEAYREETRDRLKKITTIITGVGVCIITGLVSIIATLITLL